MTRGTVAKFGGTSLADVSQIKKVIDIIRADRKRRVVVVSGPGKRWKEDHKITDLLYGLVRGMPGLTQEQIFWEIEQRFRDILLGLEVQLYLQPFFDTLRRAVKESNIDYVASRGEALMAQILALKLGFVYIDATDVIKFTAEGKLDKEATYNCEALNNPHVRGFVIPGFYGALPNGDVKTFTRGGSDLTGSIIAAQVVANLYENWTDVSGLLMTDPEVVPEAKVIAEVTYQELRELSYMGARVLHEDVIFPLRELYIPIRLCNTNRPEDPGTMIVGWEVKREKGTVVGIAGKKNFTVITLEKTLMNQELGFARKVCGVFEQNGINIEHIPGGIDTLSVVVESESFNEKMPHIHTSLWDECKPDVITEGSEIALICTVGIGMANTPGVAAKLLTAVAGAGVNIRMIDQGSSEISIMIGVENNDYERAVRAIYNAFA